MPLGVADHVWTIGELLDAALATPQRRLLACAVKRRRFPVGANSTHHVNIAGEAICPELDEKRKCAHVKAVAPAATAPGSFAMFAAIRRASSRVKEVRRRGPAGLVLVLDVRERLSALRLHDEASAVILDGPGRREAAG
jgi:hypothetical protein